MLRPCNNPIVLALVRQVQVNIFAVALIVMAFRKKLAQSHYLTRLAVEAGERRIPSGDLQNKVDPYLGPYMMRLPDHGS